MSFGRGGASSEPLTGKRLKERALDLLSRRDHSELELFRKLKEKGGPESEVGPLIDQLREYGYLDDRRFTENFVRFRSGKLWGRKRFQQELFHRGVAADIIDDVLRTLDEVGAEAEREKVHRFLMRGIDKGKEREKLFASLARRGFSLGLVRSVYDEIGVERI